MLTPGLVFLLKAAIRACSVLICVFLVLVAVEEVTGFDIPSVYIWFASVSAIPILIVVRKQWNSVHQRREMRALDASPPPSWKGKWPGNFDVLLYFKDQFDNNYLGE